VKPSASVGQFDKAATTGQPARGAATGAVTSAGFANAGPANNASRPAAVVSDAGFGGGAAGARAPSAATEVKTSGFDAAPAQTQKAAPPAERAARVTAVEILSKPTPAYTDEARRLKIEGDVVLEVEFSAAGGLRVIRTVKGLGHGLDEAAVAAAQQIRFKPALSEGRAVDYRTTIHIVFRLA
jgi:TonB family protein